LPGRFWGGITVLRNCCGMCRRKEVGAVHGHRMGGIEDMAKLQLISKPWDGLGEVHDG